MCGVVDGGITDGAWGFEAGQSGVGDIFGWYVEPCGAVGVPRRRPGPPASARTPSLSELAGRQPVGEHGLVALDWWNGNRSVLVDHELSGVLVGAYPGAPGAGRSTGRCSSRPRSAPARIIDAFEVAGVPVTELVIAGGLIDEPGPHADLRRRDPAPAQPDRLGPGPGAGRGDPRRRGGRLPTRTCRPRPRSWASGRARRLPARPGAGRRLRRRSTRSTATLHDYFGRGDNAGAAPAARASATPPYGPGRR